MRESKEISKFLEQQVDAIQSEVGPGASDDGC
jgi:hypothetical protein